MRGLIPNFRRQSGRLREQARSHSWSVGVREISVGCQVFTGAGSLATVAASCRSCVDIDAAMAVGQLTHLLLIYRYRRQASSHIGHVSLAESAPGSDRCGRGLARDGGGSVNSSVTDIPLSQASQLPHWPCIARRISARPRSLWEQACSRRRRVSHWIYN